MSNPFDKIHKKKYKTGEKALTEEKINKLLAVISDLEHLGLIQLALAAGIRREDIVRVRVKDINFDQGFVTFGQRKKKNIHTVYLSENVLNTLKMITKINRTSEYLFPGRSEEKHGKGHISGRTAYNIFNKYLKRADLSPRPFHALRASCIKLCQKKGWSPEQTARHVDDTIKVIQEHYAVPSNEEMREAVSRKPLL